MSKTTYLISEAHEWAYERGLCDRFGKFDNNIRPEGGGYIPELACDDMFAEQGAFTALAQWEGCHGETQSAYGITFPDGSALWWTEDTWSVTDGELLDITKDWKLIASE